MALLLATPLLLTGPAAHAADGSIDHVEPGDGSFQVLFSLPGAGAVEPDLDSVSVSLDGEVLPATAEPADEAEAVERTTILAMDVSSSMRKDNRFGEAQTAAKAFLAAAPDDLRVGIVTFAGDVEVAQEPTLDRESSAAVIDGLTLSNQTRLYDGVLESVTASGTEGSRSLLVLSDGRDTSDTPIERVTSAVELAQVKVDVVALAQSPEDTALLTQLADAGSGSVITADDPEALTQVFADEAAAIASQILVTVTPPEDFAASEGTLAVAVDAGGEAYTDSAFVTVASAAATPPGPDPTQLKAVEPSGFEIPRVWMYGGLVAAALGVIILIVGAVGGLGSGKDTVQDRIAAYTRKGSRKLSAPAPESQSVAAQAVGVATKVVERNANLESALGQRLEAAGMSIKPAEWLLTHAGIAFAVGLLGLLLSSGNFLIAVIGLAFGSALPWLFLSFKRSRRVKAFKAQLADTLQLMAGSLSAGLSLAQSVDTVVREGSDPMGTEFRRALVEARLGVEIEDALEGVGERMESVDFRWVVMAIRIQREVGGNLAELLTSVAETIREREYLERQVLALSAEGRLSVWILGGLPPGFMLYLLVANPEYLHPLISTPIGYIMLGGMAVLLVAGVFWMKKLVKVEV
ncbi:type II secretion system F family protein [Nocardioides iriomotensis]|uniref:VWA domain-containing protein n=1 Tax=Nocardioides iriomotensis TaxID=715784 RepID=A0A4Q5IXH5_9ACTN|nr:type II secretion system F family protein [Nocardioides iriomotensis]RYU09619.1 VWA domain-containing protein [Nocardioides iriomotensis]